MNNFLNEYSGFSFEWNIELNHFLARFNEKMNIQNVSARATTGPQQTPPIAADMAKMLMDQLSCHGITLQFCFLKPRPSET